MEIKFSRVRRFYSSISQFCANLGSQEPQCSENASSRDVLQWFSVDAKQAKAKDEAKSRSGRGKHRKYYYSHPNLQSWILGDIFLESNYIICAMESYRTILEVLSAIAPVIRHDDPSVVAQRLA